MAAAFALKLTLCYLQSSALLVQSDELPFLLFTEPFVLLPGCFALSSELLCGAWLFLFSGLFDIIVTSL